MVKRIAAFAFLCAASLLAQGVTKYGVILGGTVSNPTITNNSGQNILAYTLLFTHSDGKFTPHTIDMIGALRSPSAPYFGIPSGKTHPHKSQAQTLDTFGRPTGEAYTDVVLDCVLFEDGRVVGPDRAGSLEQFAARVQAEKDVHNLFIREFATEKGSATLKDIEDGKPDAIMPKGMSMAYQMRYRALARGLAHELLLKRTNLGDAAALQTANSSKNFPTVRKGE